QRGDGPPLFRHVVDQVVGGAPPAEIRQAPPCGRAKLGWAQRRCPRDAAREAGAARTAHCGRGASAAGAPRRRMRPPRNRADPGRRMTTSKQEGAAVKSLAASLAALPEPERRKFVQTANADELAKIYYVWSEWARWSQLPPPGDWRVWLLLAGRGFGKTRAGAEYVRARVNEGARRIALVGPTAEDTRDVMVEGDSGILAISPPDEAPRYVPSKRRVVWPNGAVAALYSADEPRRLPGPRHHRGVPRLATARRSGAGRRGDRSGGARHRDGERDRHNRRRQGCERRRVGTRRCLRSLSARRVGEGGNRRLPRPPRRPYRRR